MHCVLPQVLLLASLALVPLAAAAQDSPRAPAPTPAQTLDQLQASAARGSAQAAYELGRHYSGTTGSTVQPKKTLRYLHQAAELGHVPAQVDLAFIYHNGSAEIRKDLPAALRWFRKAAGNGSVPARCMLGDFYRRGLGGAPKDHAQAFRMYRLAATSEDRCAPKAQYEMYVSYESGQGARKDLATAVHWLKQAAEAGNPRAQATLGRAYLSGYGVPRDQDLALRWLRKSREGVSPHDDVHHDLPSFAGPALMQKISPFFQ